MTFCPCFGFPFGNINVKHAFIEGDERIWTIKLDGPGLRPGHGCPERCRATSRFVNKNLSFFSASPDALTSELSYEPEIEILASLSHFLENVPNPNFDQS